MRIGIFEKDVSRLSSLEKDVARLIKMESDVEDLRRLRWFLNGAKWIIAAELAMFAALIITMFSGFGTAHWFKAP
jgi:hypothetical protein